MKLLSSISKICVVLVLLIVVILIFLMAPKIPFFEFEDQPEAVGQALQSDIVDPSADLVAEPEPVIVESAPELELGPGSKSKSKSKSSVVSPGAEPEEQGVLKSDGLGPFAPSEALKVQESFKVDPPMRSIGQDWKSGQGTPTFIMPVSEGRDLEIQVERFESIGEEGGEFIGMVKGAPGSTVHLSYRGSAEAGRIDIPSEGRSYQILPGKDGAIIVQDRNPSLEAQAGATFPPAGIELPPVPDFIPPPPPSGIFDAMPPTDLLP